MRDWHVAKTGILATLLYLFSGKHNLLLLLPTNGL
jgi:hypothetical protein